MGDSTWRHVRRQANMAAHITAHSDISLNSPVVWVDSPPHFLVNQLMLDNVTVSSY
ncbi:unnamed protein product [Linum tenue]|uniref:RNase H type-1 domain-containing protein n=1 Tax=Linum tenue TaxID=586396 RepID=A0AAV0Q2W9_9ROSI|nr:unnamed protein product [Linum tenue]